MFQKIYFPILRYATIIDLTTGIYKIRVCIQFFKTAYEMISDKCDSAQYKTTCIS